MDCPQVGGAELAALSRLDARVARSGAHLVISTTVAALDDVFACCDQSAPQILVDPSRAERVIALGRVLARLPNLRLRELAEDDRLTLLRLTEQVGEIAARLERFDSDEAPRWSPAAFRVQSPARAYAGRDDADAQGERLSRSRAPRPPLPDPRLVRTIIRQRQMRAKFFDAELFADPAWDILLDLTAARAEHARVSVTSLCIASGVPPTTALRWIGQMTQSGLLERVEDESDRRRAFIALSAPAADAMARYFAELGRAPQVV
jgi:DNA-binding MarR family transcriptional regulator